VQIPLVDVKAQYAPLQAELEARFREILGSGQFIRGPHYYAFQEEAAAFLGVSKTIGVGNGTDAIVIVLDAMEIGPGDEVICPAFTFYATAESIARRGATPVFADSASLRKMNCLSPGRFSQKSIVERSGPAARTRGASVSFSARAGRSSDHA